MMVFYLLLPPENEYWLKFWIINTHNNEEFTIKYWQKILCEVCGRFVGLSCVNITWHYGNLNVKCFFWWFLLKYIQNKWNDPNNDPKTAPKTYWSILKIFVNGSKVPLIPPLLVNNEFVIDFLGKTNLFNDFFREQRRPITNDSSLPNNQTLVVIPWYYY